MLFQHSKKEIVIPQIKIDGNEIKNVEHFNFLGWFGWFGLIHYSAFSAAKAM